ncbi:MAG TPA: VWA domain-containing protein [Polyangiaceae bacterium]|nr:VWA domain-containing protein [Polyangiaceae bacterium]
MSFVTSLALAVGLLVLLPLLAHMLRRGKTQEFEFPAALLVPVQTVTSRRRSRVEDRVLLALRALSIVALAVLGATPLSRCSRLSVERPAGASVALALVIDDSHSMRSRTSSGQRWDLALNGAQQLLSSARTGDAIAIVQAGLPARVALSPTTDLAAVRQTISQLHVTDRSTDLGNAVRLAQSLLTGLPQPTKRVLVLSDLADNLWDNGNIAVSAPLQPLREPADNCAITQAVQQGQSIALTVACNTAQAAQGRNVSVASVSGDQSAAKSTAGAPAQDPPKETASVALASEGGVQTLQLSLGSNAPQAQLLLSGSDSCAEDDRAEVSQQSSATTVGVVVDPARAAVITGGATVVEQALAAVSGQVAVRPLALVPETSDQLRQFATLVVDDPSGLSPESRGAIEQWLARGGVALGLLGPAAQGLQLSSSLEPFAAGGHWEALPSPMGATQIFTDWVPSDQGALQALSRAGRLRLDGAELPGSNALLRWDDGVPLILQRSVGSGVVLTVGLPASVDISELALRPLFLSLFDHLLALTEARRGPSSSIVAQPWYFRADAKVEIQGPAGPLAPPRTPISEQGASNAEPDRDSRPLVIPELAGRYSVRVDDQSQQRVVSLDPNEVIRTPSEPPDALETRSLGAGSQVDISREIALVLLGLLTLELLARILWPVLQKRTA